MVNLLLILKISIPIPDLCISHHLRVSLLVLVPEEADNFDEHEDDKEKDGPGDQNHDHSVSYVVIFQVKYRGTFIAFFGVGAGVGILLVVEVGELQEPDCAEDCVCE